MMELIDRGTLLAEMPTIESEYKYARKIIQEQPTVDAELVRHGKWRHLARRIICSECGTALHDNIFRYYRHEPRYCPECGAKMDGEEEK